MWWNRNNSFFSQGEISASHLVIPVAFSVFSLGLLYAFGLLFRKLIGSIYVSADETNVCISRLTFFGNRKNEWMPVTSVMPLTDTNANINDIILELCRTPLDSSDVSRRDSLYICLRYGGISDRKKFETLFGVVWRKSLSSLIYLTVSRNSNCFCYH